MINFKGVVATDFETTGFEFFKDKIINVGYCSKIGEADIIFLSPYTNEHIKKWPKKEIILAQKINKFLKENKAEIWGTVKEVNNLLNLKFCLHNGKFDQKFAIFNKIPFRNFYFDTLVADSLIDENQPHSLNYCLERRDINYGAYDTELWQYVNKDENKKKSYQYVPPSILVKYLGFDVDGDKRLYLAQKKELEVEEMTDLFFNSKMKILRRIVDMEYQGVLMDKDLIHKTAEIIQEKQEEIQLQIEKVTGVKGFNPNSPKQVIDYMTLAGFPFAKLKIAQNKTGFSTATIELEKFRKYKKWEKFPTLLINSKKIAKIRGTYVDGKNGLGGMLKYLDENNFVHANYNIHTAVTGRFSCLDLDTEILTQRGWLKYNELKYSDSVFEYNLQTKELELRKPKFIYIGKEEQREMIRFKSKRIDMYLTSDHKSLFYTKHNKPRVVEAGTFKQGTEWNILHGANFSGKNDLDEDKIRLMVAIVSDGSFYSNRITFTLRKPRKIERLKSICEKLGIELRELSNRPTSDSKIYDTEYTFSIEKKLDYFNNCIDEDKTLTYECLNLNINAKKTLIDEFRYWDGDSTQNILSITQVKEKTINVLSAVSATCSYRARNDIVIPKNKDWQKLNRLFVTKKNKTRMSDVQVTNEIKNCAVWCITTETGFFVARRNGSTFITGNCNRPSLQVWPRPIKGLPNTRNFVRPRPGYKLFSADYSALEMYVVAALSGDEVLIKRLKDGVDIHSLNAVELGKILGIIDKKVTYEQFLDNIGKGKLKVEEIDKDIYMQFNDLRTKAKSIAFGLNYGKGAISFAEEFKIPESEAQDMIDAYFEIYKRLKKWRDNIVAQANKKGYVTLLSGRKRRFSMLLDWLNSEYSEGVWSTNMLREELARQAMNFPVQGGAHEVFESAVLRLLDKFDEEELDARLMLLIHDDIVGEAPEKDLKRIGELIVEQMPEVLNKGTKKELELQIEPDFYSDCWYSEKIKIA